MYFSLEPKTEIEDLYDRKQELSQLESELVSGRIILLTGIRRIGKTSLLNVFLELKKQKGNFSIFVDCRIFVKGNVFDSKGFVDYILREIKKLFKESAFKKLLGSIKNIKLPWLEIGMKETGTKISLPMVLDDLNNLLAKKKKIFIIAIDEAQNIRLDGKGGIEFLNLLAHAYDHLSNIKLVLTGSEVGVLHDFLKMEDPKYPLFGRYLSEIKLERFKEEEPINFLVEGFKQVGIKKDLNKIKEAVNILDGLVGYLVLYGFKVTQKKDFKEALTDALNTAEQLIKKELKELFSKSENYKFVLQAVAYGMETFSKIKEYTVLHTGKINDQTLSNSLKSLVKYSYLEEHFKDGSKTYVIPDPIVKKVVLNT